ncbi:MAG: sigma 54-interacting transcriptional regulator [Betaproteobacteria bacterium]
MSARILIVDDDAALLKLLAMRLDKEGYSVVEAASAEQALPLVEATCPALVITDMRMSGMDGLALFEAIHRKYPSLPVILLTAHGNIPDAVAATRRGVFSYLTKPFEARALMSEVERALAMAGPPVGARTDDADGAWRAALVTRSVAMEQVLQDARMVARNDASVLITGESGTGKELLARAVRAASPRAGAEFVAINCGAIPENLLESELFGHVKGAFSGAVRDHAGLFQLANHGTLFLDEIGDMPLSLQVKLLRVLQEHEVRPVGSNRAQQIDVRLICATHRDLQESISRGEFREDLYYRINVVTLPLPALRERREDIPLLVTHFLSLFGERYKRSVRAVAPEGMQLLVQANWPGNVRQLQNAVEKCMALGADEVITESQVRRALNATADELATFDEARREFERDYLTRLLKTTGGNVTQAAKLAKRNRSDFYTLLNRHEIDPATFKQSD